MFIFFLGHLYHILLYKSCVIGFKLDMGHLNLGPRSFSTVWKAVGPFFLPQIPGLGRHAA